MTGENWHRPSRSSRNLAAIEMAVAIAVLAAALFVPAAYANDKYVYTVVYTHTYDEVFQAATNAVERIGWLVTNKDKDKGVIWVQYSPTKPSHCFEMHIETLNAKPETKVTICCFKAGGQTFPRTLAGEAFSELQKVLATYGQ